MTEQNPLHEIMISPLEAYMRSSTFRRSSNIEDYRDTTKPVVNEPVFETLNEKIALATSSLAKELGSDDVANNRG